MIVVNEKSAAYLQSFIFSSNISYSSLNSNLFLLSLLLLRFNIVFEPLQKIVIKVMSMITVIMKQNNNNYNNSYRPAQFKFTLSMNITLQSLLLLLFSVFRLGLLKRKVKVLMACFIFEFYLIIIFLHRICCA